MVSAATPSVTPPMASAVLMEIMLRFFEREVAKRDGERVTHGRGLANTKPTRTRAGNSHLVRGSHGLCEVRETVPAYAASSVEPQRMLELRMPAGVDAPGSLLAAPFVR